MATFISQTQVSYEFPSEMVYERKFDTAIRSTFLHSYVTRNRGDNLNPYDKAVLRHLPPHEDPLTYPHNPVIYSEILQRVMTMNPRSNKQVITKAKRDLIGTTTKKLLDVQFRYILRNFNLSNKPMLIRKYNSFTEKLDYPPLVFNLLEFVHWLNKTIEYQAKLKRRQGKMTDADYILYLSQWNKYEYPLIGLTLLLSSDYMIVTLAGKSYMTPLPCLLMFHNKIADLISVLLLAYLSQDSSLEANAYDLVMEVLNELIKLSLQYNLKYFEIAKTLEAFAIAETLIQCEEWANREFLVVTGNDLYDATGFDYETSHLRTLLREASVPLRHELCCLSKILGHPLVDMEGGSISLHAKTTETYKINVLKVMECENYIKQNYIRNHILKFDKWPPCELKFGAPKSLEEAYVRNKDPSSPAIVRKYGKTSIGDYNFIELGQNERFHKLDNILPYLKDKTITLLRSDVMKFYLQNEHVDGRVPWEKTRLLLAYLLNPKLVHNHNEYIERYNDSTDLEDLLDYLVMRIVPKEKELKVAFRGFGCKTYEDRFRALAQEKNCMRFLDTYSDEQAMTLGELELLRRLDAFRSLNKAYVAHKILYIVIDASSWNNHFRPETVDIPLSQTLDKIFGTKIYGKTHLAYQKTLLYVPNKPTTYFWDGQSGGIEGLNQDSWVVIYLAQIKTALEGLDLHYHILCKGDDLRVAFAIPPSLWKNESMSAIKNDIVRRISETMKDFGHKIKIMESYGSSCYFAFSKTASVGNIELPQGFRKIQKCHGSSNAFIPTLDEYIGATFSNAHSTCKVQPTVFPSYSIAAFWSLYYLLQHNVYEDCTEDELVALMLVPSMLGGFPVIYLHNMHVRAESDLLSPFIGIYSFCKRSFPSVAQVMENFFYAPKHDVNEHYTMLYIDPYALPHDRPQLPSARLRGFIKPILAKYTKQEDVKDLFEATNDDSMERIHKTLSSVNELNTKILSAIYAATPEGLLSELLRKFESARSINELMVRTVGYRKSVANLRSVVKAEKHLQTWRHSRMKGKNNYHLTSLSSLVTHCPAESAERIREVLWRKKVVGITMPPLQHQVYLETALQDATNAWNNENHFTYNVLSPSNSLPKARNEHYTTCDQKPFVGYSTRSGMIEPTVYFIEKDPILQKVKNLIDVVTWTNISRLSEDGEEIVSNCPEVVEFILKSFTKIDLKSLSPFSGQRKSGTIQHHVRAPNFRESIVPNTLTNMYTRIIGASDSHQTLKRSHQHFTVNFLHVYCYVTWVCHMELEFTAKITTPMIVWGVTTPCNHCNTPIVENPLTFNTTYIQNIKMHPLAISELGNVAETILRNSIEEARETEYLVLDRDAQIDEETACLGIMQEIVDSTYEARVKLQDRFDYQHLTIEGQSVMTNLVPHNRTRDIGQSEIKRLNPYMIADYIIMLIMHYSNYKDSSGTYLSSKYTTTSGESLPWYGLVDYVYRTGFLAKVLCAICFQLDLSPPTSCYNAASASKFLGRLSTFAILKLRIKVPLVILSYYQSNSISRKLSLCIRHKLHNIIYSKYLRYMFTQAKYEVTENVADHIRLAKEVIVILYLIETLSDICDELTEDLLQNQRTVIEGLQLPEITPIELAEFCEQEEMSHYVQVLRERYALDDAFDELREVGDDELLSLMEKVNEQIMQISIPVVLTNLSQCINTVRSIASFIDGDEHIIEDLGVGFDIGVDETILIHNFTKPAETIDGRDYVPPLAGDITPIISSDESYEAISLNSALTLWGSSNGSENTCIEILTGMGFVPFEKYPSIVATCLSDGIGGFLSVLNIMFARSVFIYHTIPDNVDVQTIPTAAVTVTDDGLTYLNAHLSEGYYDLKNEETIRRLLQYNKRSDIVTCDIELSDDSSHEHIYIYPNIIKYYLTARTGRCILICKFRLDNAKMIGQCIDVLAEYCVTVSIMQPRASKYAKYAYMVASGWRKAYLEEDCFHDLVSVNTNRMFRRFFRVVRNKLEYNRRLMDNGYDITQTDHHKYAVAPYVMFMNQFPSRAPSIMAAELELMYTRQQSTEGCSDWVTIMDKCVDTKTPSDLCRKMKFNMNQMIRSWKQMLASSQYDDRAVHRELINTKISFVYGVWAVLSSYRGLEHPWIQKKSYWKSVYVAFYDSLEVRDRRGDLRDVDPFIGDIIYEGRAIRYPTYFCRGVDLGIAIASNVVYSLRKGVASGARKGVQKRTDGDKADDDST